LTSIPYLRALTWGTVTVFTAVAVIVAVAFPLHASDALTFGEWSRLIAEHWSRVFDLSNRPLFYVLQGSLWHLIGYSDTSGRLLCGIFSVLLVGALAWLVAARPWGHVAAALVTLFTLAVPVFAIQAVSSLTDVVVASLLALAAAFAVRLLPERLWMSAAAGIAAMLAVLAKPSAVLALLGITAAQTLARHPIRACVLRRVLPLAAGTLAGFAYYVVQTARAHVALRPYLEAGVTGPYYSQLAAATRRLAILDAAWFGDLLRTVVIFTLLYTAARLIGTRHRTSVAVAVPAAAIASWLLPWIGRREGKLAVGPFANASSFVAWLVTCGVLVATLVAPDDAVPERRELLQFTLWALLPLVGWMTYATYDARLLSPAWPGLLALMTVCTMPAVAGLSRVPALALAPVVGLTVAVALNVYNIDGLGRSGWDQWRRTPAFRRFDVEATRAIVLPDLTKALAVARPLMGAHNRMLSPEGAFRFFFPGRVDQTFPASCAQLSPYRVFVLTTDAGSKSYMENILHVSGDPSYWAACKQPRLRFVTSGAEGYAVFAVGS
jgi:hypothetical protein